MSEVVWRRRECVGAKLEGDFVLLDLETLKYHALNPTATAVWTILSTPHTADEIVSELLEKYEVSREACSRSVDSLLTTLSKRALITAAADTPVSV